MAAKVRGITIEIGGDASGLEKALKEVNSSIKSTQSQLKDVNKLLKLDPGNAELIAQKQRLLGEATSETAKKLDVLKKAAKEAEKALSEGTISTEQYDALQREIVSCETELKKLDEETKNFANSSSNISQIGEKFKEVGNSISDAGKKMAVISAAVSAAGAACVKYASDAEEASNKVDVSFGSSAQTVKDFAETSLESFGIARGSALDMAALFGDMATSMGLSQSAAADMSTTLVGLAGDLASFKNVSLDTAQTALKGVFTGETESLKNLGVVMNETTLKAYALEKGINKSYSEMSQAEKVQLRYQYVLEATKNAQGDFANTSDGTANSLRIFKESMKELAESFGNVLLPIITPIIQSLTKVIQIISNLPTPIKNIIVVIGALVAVAGPLLIIIGSLVSSVGSLITNIPVIITGLTAIATTIQTAVIPAIVSAGSAFVAFIAANPIILAVAAAVVVLGIAIYELVKHWDEVSEACTRAWDKIKQTVSESDIGKHFKKDLDEIVDAFKNAGGGIKGALSAGLNAAKNVYETVIQSMFGISDKGMERIESTFINGFRKIADFIKNIPDAFREAIERIQSLWDNLIQSAKTWGEDLVSNFTDGLTKMLDKVEGACKKVAQSIKDILGFSEPKKGPLSNFHTYAPDMIDLWCKGVEDNLYKVSNMSNTLAEAMNPSSTINGKQLNQQAQTNSALNSIQSSLGNLNQNTTINVVLEGDAQGIFRVVRQENSRMIKSTGYHALA